MKPITSRMEAGPGTGTVPPFEMDDWLKETLRHIHDIQYGQVILTIHQGEVTEVQKTERRRFKRSRTDS